MDGRVDWSVCLGFYMWTPAVNEVNSAYLPHEHFLWIMKVEELISNFLELAITGWPVAVDIIETQSRTKGNLPNIQKGLCCVIGLEAFKP